MLSHLYLCTWEGDHPGVCVGKTIPQPCLGAAPGTQMAVLMLEPFPSLHPRRRWRQGDAGQAGSQAVPPASILLFLLPCLPGLLRAVAAQQLSQLQLAGKAWRKRSPEQHLAI